MKTSFPVRPLLSRFVACAGTVIAVLSLGACGDGEPVESSSESQLALSPSAKVYRNSPWINIPLAIDGPYSHLGLDVAMDDYRPCSNPSDPSYAACDTWSYLKVMYPGSFPYGIFIENETNGIRHDFAKKLTWAAAEIYTHRCTGFGDQATGGMRVETKFSRAMTNAPVYSKVPAIRLPQRGDSDATLINGYVWGDGGPWFDNEQIPIEPECNPAPKPRLTFDIFQNVAGGASSFASVANKRDESWVDENGRQYGFFSSGPIKKGSYKMYIGDRMTNRKIALIVSAHDTGGERFDVDLSVPDLCDQYRHLPACFTCASFDDCSGLNF